jgi:hypothetical protein
MRSAPRIAAAAALLAVLNAETALAASDADIAALRQEIRSMKQAYETRIDALESKLKDMETAAAKSPPSSAQALRQPVPAPGGVKRAIYDNRFNPSIGVLLNGKAGGYSREEAEIAGFAVGHEGERGKEGIAVDHSELNFSANADDKFYGSLTAAVAEHEGETEIELEEAHLQTLPGAGLPAGLGIKAGRALWTLGYLNERHAHADDFADRPLPYRVFLNHSYNDDGAEISYVLPTDFYAEIGGGAFRGDDFPFGGAKGEGAGAWSAYARVGGDVANNQDWRVGAYVLSGESNGGRPSNEDAVSFIGDVGLYVADVRYNWAPTGNPKERELSLQGEYFRRTENGSYEDAGAGTGPVAFDGDSDGWYAQAVYKFHPQWRTGARYSRLDAHYLPAGLAGSALDGNGHDPEAYALMTDWTNSEFSRVRLQYNYETPDEGRADHQFLLQYVLSLGAHAAHMY